MTDIEGSAKLPRHLQPGFDLREALLVEALLFIQGAGAIPGVIRLAMIGSLLTSKRRPKDCDLLASVTDEVEMARLAKLGRRLKGRTGAMGSGADVFLCDAEHHYIGRICQWRECWPRVLCRARNCGLRPGLNDDLDVVSLGLELTLTPPVELFPTVIARADVPEDVQRVLLGPLMAQEK
ncbi:MAG: hypothetical protein ABIF09_19165 [Gemmatimonadota bacterium]